MFFAQVGKFRHQTGAQPVGLRLFGGDIGPGHLGARRFLAKAHYRIADRINPALDIGCKGLAHIGRKLHMRQGSVKIGDHFLALVGARRVGRGSPRLGTEIALHQKGKGLIKRCKVIGAKFRVKPVWLRCHHRAEPSIKIKRGPPRGNRILPQGQSVPGRIQRRAVQHPDFGTHGMDIALKLCLVITLKHQPLQIARRA